MVQTKVNELVYRQQIFFRNNRNAVSASFLSNNYTEISEQFFDALTEKQVVKTSWPEVSNYWVDDKTQKAFKDGLNKRKNNSLESAEEQTLLEICGKLPLGEHRDNIKKEDAIKMFIQAFLLSQQLLKKTSLLEDIKRPEYLAKLGKRSGKDSATDSLATTDLITRRMCKWILHVAHVQGKSVIYSLDKLDLSPVATGDAIEFNLENNEDNPSKQKVPVCTSELREIFRNIDKLCSDKEPTIQFYENFMPAAAPWIRSGVRSEEENDEILREWARYAMHLTRKLLISHPKDKLAMDNAGEILKFYNKRDCDNIIKCYKEMKPSQLLPMQIPLSPCELKARNSRIQYKEKQDDYSKIIENLENSISELDKKAEATKPKPGLSGSS